MCTSSSITDSPLWFTVVPHKDVALAHHLEVGTFHANYDFPSVPGPFMRTGEDLGHSREVVEIFEIDIMNSACVVFQVQDDGAYPTGFDDSPGAVGLCLPPHI